ncbi:MAG TPA: hypothetical protein VKI64_01935 [Acidimicrobiales bacterium]|nr:hypothetical protein [Acidimicrobiales bacterium]
MLGIGGTGSSARLIGRVLVVISVAGGSLLIAGSKVGASPAGTSLDCTAAGAAYPTVDKATDDVSWSIVGRGSCNGSTGNYYLDFTGSGTSHGLSVCTGEPFVQNLALSVTVDLTDSTAPAGTAPFVSQQAWTTPATTYPENMQWAIESGGSVTGAGEAFTRIFAHCPGSGGSPTGNFGFRFRA